MGKKISIAFTLILVALLAYYITDNYVLKESKFVLHATYDDITGLTASDPVWYNGYKVGEIVDIRVHPDNSEYMVVYFSITQHGMKIPIDSKAELISTDLMGNRAISLILGDSAKMTVHGDSLMGGQELEFKERVMARFQPVKDHLDSLMNKTKASFSNVTGIFDSTTTSQMKLNFELMQKAVTSLKATKVAIDTLMVHEKHKFANIKSNIGVLTNIMKEDSLIIDKAINDMCELTGDLLSFDVQGALAKAKLISAYLAQVKAEMKKAHGTVPQLMYTTRMEEAVNELNNEINKLIKHANENIDQYTNFSVFGKKANNKKLNAMEKQRLDSLILIFPELKKQLQP
jgi:phospholipid/cholesterol/gamma-HCH transport system substrate-binding protein